MLFIYRSIINIIFILSPIIILIRLINQKEDLKRFKEKIGFFSQEKVKGKLIWFHGASVGELKSVIPLIERFEKDKKINQILITSNTLSSSKIIKEIKFKKVIHQFFPIDNNFIVKKFINHWKPSKVFFIDSEIWPNTILNLKKSKISLILINARITKKTFQRWIFFKKFAKKIFSSFDICLSSNKETKRYLKILKANNIKYFGNLKFIEPKEKKIDVDLKLKMLFKNKKVWCASSTHKSEEITCGKAHLKLKKKFKNLLTIIIPRHVERSSEIKNDLEKLKLNVHMHETDKKISNQIDIYLVNSYGLTKVFFNNCKNVFLGGSLIKHGGQNPLEAVRYGCNILHGVNVFNFSEIYQFLKKNKISKRINNQNDLIYNLNKLLSKKNNNNKIQKKLKTIGKKILNKTYEEIKF
tara:strand:+ start:3992 stop:5227 length:1236 start_codon:yes stop_codon:yes gene_type:complete